MNVTLTANSNSITIKAPEYPIETEIQLSVHIVNMPDGSYKIWDDGTIYDYRITNIKKWQLPEAQQILFDDFIYNSTKGRGNDIEISLPLSSGFFLFGPDFGDAGTFTIRVLSHDATGLKMSPRRWFENNISLLLIDKPVYTPPASNNEGSMVIGTVNGIRQPQIESKPFIGYTIKTEATRGGLPCVVDMGKANDSYNSEIEIQGTQSKISEVVSFLTGIRGGEFAVSTPYHYMFGTKRGKDGPWNCKLISDKLTIKNDGFNRFRLTGVKLNNV